MAYPSTETFKRKLHMKVFELIDKLKDLPPHMDVLVWDAGNRANIASVDDSFIDDKDYPFVELNTDTDD